MKDGHFFYDSYTKKEGLDASSGSASPKEKLVDPEAPSPTGNVPQEGGDRNSSSSPLTETGGNPSYSLTTKAEQDRLDEALQKHLNRSPEARLAVYERMRANLDRVIARNNDSMLALRDGRDYQISAA